MATITDKTLVEHIVATTNMLLGTKHLVKDVSKIEEDKVHNMYDVYVNDRLVASTNMTTVKEFCHLQ